MWLSADTALLRLGVKPQSLYASVSRGRIRAKADPGDSRRSLYSAEDIDRLAGRRPGRVPDRTIAEGAIGWGDPVIATAISTISGGRLIYRGQDAVALSAGGTLEEVAQLLWPLDWPLDLQSPGEGPAGDGSPFGAALVALARRAAGDAPSHGRGRKSLGFEAEDVLATVADAICGPGQGLLHDRLAARWRRPRAAAGLRRALVLLADHELNASTFAARVAVSTGASLAAGALAGLATLTGPLHGSASLGVFALARRADEIGAEAALREQLAEGRPLAAAGHRLYPEGDVRATALLEESSLPPPYAALAEGYERLVGERPNVDFALAALAARHGLPETAPGQIFALARSVGWLAHMLEQVETGTLIRPRARYTGPKPSVP